MKKLVLSLAHLLVYAFILSGCSSSGTPSATAPFSANPPAKTMAVARYLDAGNNGWKEGFWYGGVDINPGLSYFQFLAANFRPSQVVKLSMVHSKEFVDIYNQLIAVPDLNTVGTLGKQLLLQAANNEMPIPIYTNIYAHITQPYVHTNYMSIHRRVWDVILDWMENTKWYDWQAGN
jgi:hypothetical protein